MNRNAFDGGGRAALFQNKFATPLFPVHKTPTSLSGRNRRWRLVINSFIGGCSHFNFRQLNSQTFPVGPKNIQSRKVGVEIVLFRTMIIIIIIVEIPFYFFFNFLSHPIEMLFLSICFPLINSARQNRTIVRGCRESTVSRHWNL